MEPLVAGALAAASVACLGRAVVTSQRGDDAPGASTLARRDGLAPERMVRWWVGVLDDVGVDGEPRRWGRVVLGGALLATVGGGVRAGAAGALAASLIAAVTLLVARLALAGRGARRADRSLAELLDHAGRGIRTGLDLPRALRSAGQAVGGRHGTAVEDVVGRVEAGAELDAALATWVAEQPRAPVRLVAGAVAVAGAAGGGPTRALDGIAATLRSRSAVADEARSLASQARASAAVLVVLPFVVAAGGAAADRRVAAALVGTGWGRACLLGAIVLDAAGATWMQRTVGSVAT